MPWIIAAAMIGSAVVGAMSASDAADKSADAATQSAQAQLQASRESIAYQKEMYAKNAAVEKAQQATNTAVIGKQRADNTSLYTDVAGYNTPYIQSGISANKLYGDLSGANGEAAQKAALAAYQSSPYLQQMIENTDASVKAAAGRAGTGVSGNVLDDLYKQNAALYNNDYTNYLANLNALQNQGQVANQTLAGETGQLMSANSNLTSNLTGANSQLASALMGAGTSTANAATNATMTGAQNYGQAVQAAGNAQAAGSMGVGNAVTGALNNYMNYTMMQNMLNKGSGASAAA